MNTSPSASNRNVETLKSISRSLFFKTSRRKDSPLKNGTSHSSPTSVTAKTLFAGINLYYEALAPDSLFKLIKDLKWKMAVSRIAQFQDESCRWVVDHDDTKKEMLYRRLPIHEACIRNPTVEVVAALLGSYPEGASAKDEHSRTALHCAVIHGAHIDVIYLLLHASYDVVQGQDFFHKIPKDYAHTTTSFTHKAEVIAALTKMSKEDVAAAAAGVRAAIQASHPIRGNRSLNETTKQEGSTYDETAQQLSQALVDSDAANTLRSIAVANEEAGKVQVTNLQTQVIGIKKQLEQERGNQERSQNCIFLLEKKQETFINSLTEKNEVIKRLKEQTQRDGQQKQADAVMRQKLKKTVSTLTQRLAGNEEESVEYWKVKAEKLFELNEQALEKQHSIEEHLQVYMDRSRDMEEKLSLAKENFHNTLTKAHDKEVLEKELVHSETALKTTAMEKLLDNAQDALEANEQKVITLEEDINKAYDENDALKVIVEKYHSKLSHLEASFYDLSGHLVDKSEQLSTASSDLNHLDEERMRLTKERHNADTRIESLEALIGEYKTDLQDSKELSKMGDAANAKIRELENIIIEYDQENHSLDEKCSAYEHDLDGVKKFRDMASKKIESLENALDSIESKMARKNDELEQLDQENHSLDEKCSAYEHDLDGVKKFRDMASKKIESLENALDSIKSEMARKNDELEQLDQENHSLDEKCSAYEHDLDGVKKFRDMASKKIESLENALDSIESEMAWKNDELEQLVDQYSRENTTLGEKYNACHKNLERCKTESIKKISSLEDLVQMYRQQSEEVEKYRAKAKEATSMVERLQKDIACIQIDRSVLKKELAKACQKNGHLSSTYKDLNSKTKKLELSYTRATAQLIDRTVRSGIPPITSRIRRPLASRTRVLADNSDCMSVCSVSNSVVSCNSVTSTQSARSNSSSSSRRSALLALRTQRVLKHRNNEMSSTSFEI